MFRAVFLDRDGVINHDAGYVHTIEDFKFLAGTFEALKLLQDNGFKLIIITNQSGIGVGKYTEKDFMKVTDYMLAELAKYNICIDSVHFCPHAPDDNCACRKPGQGMINEVLKKLLVDFRYSYFIGDKTSDIKLGNDIGCKTFLVQTGFAGSDKVYDTPPTYKVKNLLEAARFIVDSSKKIVPLKEIQQLIPKIRWQDKKIVTLNGSFDILHPGHAYIIREARRQGDILIVGLNSDSSIKQYKGGDRPVLSERERAELLASFADVDYITIFDDITPINFIEAIKPDVHVTGAEYGENCIEAETARKYGRLHLVPRIGNNLSTTDIFKKIKNLDIEKKECSLNH